MKPLSTMEYHDAIKAVHDELSAIAELTDEIRVRSEALLLLMQEDIRVHQTGGDIARKFIPGLARAEKVGLALKKTTDRWSDVMLRAMERASKRRETPKA